MTTAGTLRIPSRCARAATSGLRMSRTSISQEGHAAPLTCAIRSLHAGHPALDELVGLEVHDLGAVAMGAVFPAEAHDPPLEAEEALVGDGDAVSVAAEILQDLPGAGEGWFGVDDPVPSPQGGEEGGERPGVGQGTGRAGEGEPCRVEGVPQGVEILRPEDLRPAPAPGTENRA